MTMHLSIYKLADVMPTVWPLKNTKTVYLTLNKVATVNKNIFVLFRITIFPLFEAFTVNVSIFENSSYLDLIVIKFFYTFTLYFIVYPHPLIFDLFTRLFIFTVAMKVAVL
jgi:hypothetical protein